MFRQLLTVSNLNLMISKDALKSLIDSIKDATGLGQEEISIEAGYKSTTLTELLSKGKRLDAAYKRLEIRFRDRLKNTMSEPTEVRQHFTADQLFHMYMKAMERQDRLMETQNEILNDIRKKMAQESTQAKMIDDFKEMKATLSDVWNGLRVVATRQGTDREVALSALSKLTGKKEDALLREANKKTNEILKATGVQDNMPA